MHHFDQQQAISNEVDRYFDSYAEALDQPRGHNSGTLDERARSIGVEPSCLFAEMQRRLWAAEIIEFTQSRFGVKKPSIGFIHKMSDLIRAELRREADEEAAVLEYERY